MPKATPIPTPTQPDVTCPVPRTDSPNPAACVYVPGEGLYASLYAGGKFVWQKAHENNMAGHAVRKTPAVCQWLVSHPLSVLFGDVSETEMAVTDIFMSGEWLADKVARENYPKLPWPLLYTEVVPS